MTSLTCAEPPTSVTCAEPQTFVTCAEPLTFVTCAEPPTSVTCAESQTFVTCAEPPTSVTCAEPLTFVTCAEPLTFVTCAESMTSLTCAESLTSLTCAKSCTRRIHPDRTSHTLAVPPMIQHPSMIRSCSPFLRIIRPAIARAFASACASTSLSQIGRTSSSMRHVQVEGSSQSAGVNSAFAKCEMWALVSGSLK